MDKSFWDGVVGAAQAAGPFGTLLMMGVSWLLWRSLQKKDTSIVRLTETGIRAMTSVKESLNSIHRKLDGGRKRRGR